MAFAQNFHIGAGDVVQTSYIARTLKEKLYIKPGVTVNANISIPSAEYVLYWKKGTAAADSGARIGADGNTVETKPGARQQFAEKALERVIVGVDKSYGLSGVIPGVNLATCTADQLNAYVVDDTIKASQTINRDFIAKLQAKATKDSAAATGLPEYDENDVYESILALAAKYKEINASSYMEPTALFVKPTVYAKLVKNNLIYFKDNSPVSVFPFEVIECPDAEMTSNMILMNGIAMVNGVAFDAVKSMDASVMGYANGVAYIGEICYVSKETELGPDEANLKLVLAI